MNSELAEVRDTNELLLSIETAKNLVTKDYLYDLKKYEVCELPEELKNIDIADYTRLFHFEKFVSDKKENMLDKLTTVLNAAYTSDSTVTAIIKGTHEKTDYYLGVVSKDIEQNSHEIGTQSAAFKGVLSGNFPGLTMKSLNHDAIQELCGSMFSDEYVTSVSGISSLRNSNDKSMEKYVQGMEHLVDSLQGKEYSLIVIADPVSNDDILITKLGYEKLYTQLSPFLKTSFSFNESESLTLNRSQTNGFTETIGESNSLTQNYSKTNGWSESYSKSENTSRDIGAAVGNVIGTGVGIAASVLSAGTALPFALSLIPSVSGIFSSLGSAMTGSRGTSYSSSDTQSGSTGESFGKASARNTSRSDQQSFTEGESTGNTQGRTMQFNNENKTVKNLLQKIDKQIERLDKCEAFGAFNCSAYILSSDPETNAVVANGYNALVRGDTSSTQSSCINEWDKLDANSDSIKAFLAKFSHPLFYNPNMKDIVVSPASLVNSYELAVSLGFPKKSVTGLPVFESAAFGRNVFESESSILHTPKTNLGNIYHMGSQENTNVALNTKSLAMHTFITGSTGSGKSNTVYQILREMKKQNIPFLVIEPAKGEYKHIFGNDEDTSVYGTNPYYTPLLRINPFQFPKGIHVLEHIDRLVEIFNVCWPMYAAMPAVLKDSVERAYISAGWNLSSSVNRYSEKLFPTFSDVLSELTNVVAESAFSQEVKDNYTGSLATRIKSLTNGMYSQIFVGDEIGDESLFDRNVIIDLSRIGSMETKSMLMGILVMRLQEYRMTSGNINSDLRHITVLEEAHNLLKRTSTEQSSESSNLLGKSVEMLSNAIAEVRTYGEGFVIADQAPGLLDMSVIRNTNTKIIMRLPDAEDRNLVGKSANLSEEQIKEISKLPTGIAAVYQNNWLEPVLCKVLYQNTDNIYRFQKTEISSGSDNKKTILLSLFNKAAGEKLDFTVGEITQMILNSSIPTKSKIKAVKTLKRSGNVSVDDISGIVYDIIQNTEIEKAADKAESIEEWKDTLIYHENSLLDDLNENFQNIAVECILMEQIRRYGKPDDYLTQWYKYLEGEVM